MKSAKVEIEDLVLGFVIVLIVFGFVAGMININRPSLFNTNNSIHYLDKVKIKSGFYAGRWGTVLDREYNGEYKVQLKDVDKIIYVPGKLLIRNRMDY